MLAAIWIYAFQGDLCSKSEKSFPVAFFTAVQNKTKGFELFFMIRLKLVSETLFRKLSLAYQGPCKYDLFRI